MDMQIIRNDGTSFTLSDHHIQVSDFIVESIEMEDSYSAVDGLHGRYLDGSKYKKRKIHVLCFFEAQDNIDYAIQRDLLYRLTQDTEPFYIREMRKSKFKGYDFRDTVATDYQPVDNLGKPIIDSFVDEFVSAKRYYVKLSNVLTPVQKKFKCNVELEFETVELPFSESIGTSLDLQKKKLDNLFSTDMQINYEDREKHTYSFNNVNSGRIFYYGSVPITQHNMYSRVSIIIGEKTKNFAWSLSQSNAMTIEGIQLNPGDLIVYEGNMITKNGIPIIEYVNLELPKFKYGFNKFQFNQNVRKVEFDTRFYFK
ncbi:phage tail domain-containing protein [Mammaliicoccus sciuri]|uniref:phage tail domain-containing protein n=1 Tax=Mammaliicoccus sciuri TaxID=1296 RepID=UPI0037CC67FD